MSSEDAAPPRSAMLPVELTLIVAATRNMGIGRAGALPWMGLKKEMAYFARVTKRLNCPPADAGETNSRPTMNAVVMGRKTWESIPERFRPLKGRVNIILSRSHPSGTWDGTGSDTEPIRLSSISSVLAELPQSRDLGKLYVIGGAEIYREALQAKNTKRILLTRVLTDFDCDTLFPISLGGGYDGEWRKKTKEELDAWTGEQVPEGIQEENGIRYVFEMYERD